MGLANKHRLEAFSEVCFFEMVRGGGMFTNVHPEKQNMPENAFQFVAAIYLNMQLMFEIYGRVCRASAGDASSWEMLPFTVCLVQLLLSREHSALACLPHARHFWMFIVSHH